MSWDPIMITITTVTGCRLTIFAITSGIMTTVSMSWAIK